MGIVQLGDQALSQFPDWFKMVFTSSPVVMATIVVFLLNIIMPKKTLEQEEKERKEMDEN